MKYKLAIFDFDGTLADSFPWLLSVMDSVAEYFGIKPPPLHQIEALRRFDPKTLLKMHDIPLWKMVLIARHVNQRMGQEIHRIPMFAGVDRMFEELARQGTQMALVSSNSAANIRQVLGPKNSAFINYWECGISIFGKSAKLRKILLQSGIQPKEAICIGDEIRDIEAAQKIAIPFGAVAWGFCHIEALIDRGPTEVFASVDELIQELTQTGAIADLT